MIHPRQIQLKRLKTRMAMAILGMLTLFLAGTVTYCYIEKWNFGDSAHYTFTSVLTVGHDDSIPISRASKIFGFFFVTACILMLLYFAFLIFTAYRFHKERPEKWIEIRRNLKRK
jgi:cellobiose-specific phosphotransferase system component IIC